VVVVVAHVEVVEVVVPEVDLVVSTVEKKDIDHLNALKEVLVVAEEVEEVLEVEEEGLLAVVVVENAFNSKTEDLVNLEILVVSPIKSMFSPIPYTCLSLFQY